LPENLNVQSAVCGICAQALKSGNKI